MRQTAAAYAVALLILTLLGLVQFGLSMQEFGTPHAWEMAVLGKGTLYAFGLAYLPALLWIHHRWPPRSTDWVRHYMVVLATLLVYTVFVIAVEFDVEAWLLREEIIFRGSLVAMVIGEWMVYALAAAAPMLLILQRQLREREHQAIRLEAGLAEARLQALTMQIHPHFLFNTLTAISVLVHRDPAAADAMLTRLSALLRATVDGPVRPEITLGEELALLREYLGIMKFRFGPRLTVEEAIDDRLTPFLVPPFLLQPLVENALEHGIGRRAGPGKVTVSATDVNDRFWLTVVDDGVGLDDEEIGEGIGLPNTIRRLNELYGTEASLTLEAVTTGGTRVTVELPKRVLAGSRG